jgi:murein DD-endopeptidase MepM/ murein hydrolase activator NlpD
VTTTGGAVGTAAAPAAAAKPAGTTMKHTVKSGETLGTIAQKYGVRQRDLAIANNITDPLKLAAGKELTIPGWDAANGKAAAKSPSKSPSSGAPTPKPAADTRPLFTTPQLDQPAPVIVAQPPGAPTGEVPVIRVDETPAPKKP